MMSINGLGNTLVLGDRKLAVQGNWKIEGSETNAKGTVFKAKDEQGRTMLAFVGSDGQLVTEVQNAPNSPSTTMQQYAVGAKQGEAQATQGFSGLNSLLQAAPPATGEKKAGSPTEGAEGVPPAGAVEGAPGVGATQPTAPTARTAPVQAPQTGATNPSAAWGKGLQASAGLLSIPASEQAQAQQMLQDPNLSPEQRQYLTLGLKITQAGSISPADMQQLIAMDKMAMEQKRNSNPQVQTLGFSEAAPVPALVNTLTQHKDLAPHKQLLASSANVGELLLNLAKITGQPGGAVTMELLQKLAGQ